MDLSFLMVFLKKYFVHPAKRQNFDDASGLKRNHSLKTCHICEMSISESSFKIVKYFQDFGGE